MSGGFEKRMELGVMVGESEMAERQLTWANELPGERFNTASMEVG